MSDSLIELMDGDELSRKSRAIDQAIAEVEQRHIEYFKSQPPEQEGEEHLHLSNLISKTTFSTNDSIKGMQRDVSIGMRKDLPEHIWKDLTYSLDKVLASFGQ